MGTVKVGPAETRLEEEKGWWRRTYAMQRHRVYSMVYSQTDTSLPRKFISRCELVKGLNAAHEL